MADKRLCAVDGCGNSNIHSFGFCGRHAYHFKRHGDPLAGKFGGKPGEPQRWIKDHATYQGDDCLKWPFEITHWGYGSVLHKGKKRLASRVMCEEAHGEPPTPDHEACHSCGNGHLACMNQRHLRWATRTENIEDAVAQDTWMKGELARSAKLTRNEVRQIRALRTTMTQKELGAMFGVRGSAISRILSGSRWEWLL